MFGWLAFFGWGLTSAFGSLTVPSGAELVPVPALPLEPNAHSLDARGTCAVIRTDLGFLAHTTDDGQTFRAIPTPPPLLEWRGQLYCAGDRLFYTLSSSLFGLMGDAWQRLGPPPGPAQAKFIGVVQARDVLYVGTGSHVLASRDGGTTFTPALAHVDALASDGTDVFAAKDKQLYQVGVSETLTLVSTLKTTIRVLAIADGALFAATERQLFRSEDRGKTWKPVPEAPTDIVEMRAYSGSLLVQTSSETRVRDAKGRWSRLDRVYRARPGVNRLWLIDGGGSIGHVSKIGDALSPDRLPKDPMPTVRALAANGKTLVVALYRPASVHVSADSGKTWLSACPNATVDQATLDETRLQLAWHYPDDVKKCATPGLKMRAVPRLPEETCNGDLCVRFANGALLRSRDRGKTWQDLTANLGGKASIAAAAAAGRELIVARQRTGFSHMSSIWEYSSLYRSIDDGQTFTPLTLPFKVTAFAAGDEGWFFGTHLYGVLRIPYAAAASLRVE